MSRVIDVERLQDAAKWCSDNHIPLYLSENARITRYGKIIVTRDAWPPGFGMFAKFVDFLFRKTRGTRLKPLLNCLADAWDCVYTKNDLTPRTMPLVWFAPHTSREIYV